MLDCSNPSIDDYSSDQLDGQLISSMNDYWPDIKSGMNPQFWSYEWSKHGKCAQLYGAVTDLYDFFSQGITMYQAYDIMVDQLFYSQLNSF